jgi:hypothetical protein
LDAGYEPGTPESAAVFDLINISQLLVKSEGLINQPVIRQSPLMQSLEDKLDGSANQAVVFRYRRSRGSSPSDSKSSSCPRKRCPHRLNSFSTTFYEQATLGIAVEDLEGKLLLANPAPCSIAGKCAWVQILHSISGISRAVCTQIRQKPMQAKRIMSSLYLYPGQTSPGTSPGFQCSDNAVKSRKRIENKQARIRHLSAA